MDALVTVRTFTYPLDVAVIRGRLETEGITCFTQDEMVAQANPLYSNAIGGVKLQVWESDLPRALEILEEGGYLKEEDFLPSAWYTQLDNATFRITALRGMRLEFRLMVIVALLVSAVMLLLWLSM